MGKVIRIACGAVDIYCFMVVDVEFKNVKSKNGVRLEYYFVDDNHGLELVREEIFTAKDFATYVKMPNYSTYLLRVVKL